MNKNNIYKGIAMALVTAVAFSVMGCNVTETKSKTSGLKDYEGFYCMTGTEEIEDYEVTYTYGYQFNSDGTGVCYGQDDVDFTWNETEICFADNTVPFSIESGKLSVENMVYDKIEGNFITPNICNVDVDNVENGIYHAHIDDYGINESGGKVEIRTEIFTEDTYNKAGIDSMKEGDVIYIDGILIPVKSISKTSSGILNINGGLENGGSALIAEDESKCYVYAGMDLERSYTCQGIANLSVNDDVKLIDKSNPAEEIEYTGNNAVSALREMVREYPLNRYNCSVVVENGVVVEINRLFIP